MNDSLPYTEDDDIIEYDCHSPYSGMNRKERRYEAKLKYQRLKREAKQRKKNLYPEQL